MLSEFEHDTSAQEKQDQAGHNTHTHTHTHRKPPSDTLTG